MLEKSIRINIWLDYDRYGIWIRNFISKYLEGIINHLPELVSARSQGINVSFERVFRFFLRNSFRLNNNHFRSLKRSLRFNILINFYFLFQCFFNISQILINVNFSHFLGNFFIFFFILLEKISKFIQNTHFRLKKFYISIIFN
jgi:hypothetical protein